MVELVPAAFWNFENVNPGAQEGERESTWDMPAVTTYGPSSIVLDSAGAAAMVSFSPDGARVPARATGARGQRPGRSLTARLQGEAERSLADEAAGPLAQLIAVPQDGGADDEDTDPLASLKADVAKARGKAMLLETTAAGWGEGKSAAPSKDWKAERLGPAPARGAGTAVQDGIREDAGSVRMQPGVVRRLGRHGQEGSVAAMAPGHRAAAGAYPRA